ncbi:MAG: hypothetical protein JSV88_06690 [Candidatus Aminicenantes bacterium]|nr:MAG: hypothetical protein JSV88_06690 [Candidatus Aminicenantes bacterium]
MKKDSGFLSKWKRFANRMGQIQTFILMTIIYFLIVPIFSLVRFSDPLKLRLKKKSTSYWEAKKEIDTSLEKMKQLD